MNDIRSERRRILALILIMTAVAGGVAGIALFALYETAFEQQRGRLIETVQSQARLMEAVARFDAQYSTEDVPGGAFAATLGQIRDAHLNFTGFGETGEFVLARREGDLIVFLLSHRYEDVESPEPLPYSSELAGPMRRALSGESGTIVDLDYRGATVLAAYEPVAILDLGMVVKIDVAEIRAPFVKTGLLVVVGALLLISIGTLLFRRIGDPLIQRLITGNAALRESEQKYRLVSETATDGIITMDQSSQMIYVNPSTERIFGYSAAEMLGQKVTMLMPESFQANHVAALRRFVATGQKSMSWSGIELTGRHKSGREFPIEISIGEMKQADDGFLFTGVVRDITERRQAEETVRRSEANYRGLIEHATYGIYRSSPAGAFLTANPALIEMLGYESADELLGAGLATDVYAELRQRGLLIEEHSETERIEGLEVEWKQKDGTPITVRLSGRPVLSDEGELECFEMIAEDVTERRKLEAQVRQSQKMEAVGRLAGGVAHDFNNLLTVIVGESEMALADLPEDAPVREGLDEIRQAADRAAGLTRQLLTFSRRQIIEPTVFSLNDLVSETDKMLGRLIGEDIELVTRTEPDLGSVEADRGQMEQVVVNLVVNARDAMPKGGKLVIETANVTLDEGYAASHADVKAGDYVALSVSDSGTGMTAETMAHLFEPFFTTKERGQGTGLGLATSYGIVKQSGGHIAAYSELGIGTTMKVYLPRIAAPAGDDVRPEAAELPHGTETVLLVEDEERVLAVGKRILEGQGYTVLEAADAEEALRLIENQTGPLHLLLTDVVLPKMDGRLLAERINELRPDVKVLFTSGYTEDVVLKHRLLAGEVALLQKPFTRESLARTVREVLNADARHERS